MTCRLDRCKLATIGGHVDTTVTADSPLYAVFKGGGSRTYLGFNAGGEKLTAGNFSDGAELKPAPRLHAKPGRRSSPAPSDD